MATSCSWQRRVYTTGFYVPRKPVVPAAVSVQNKARSKSDLVASSSGRHILTDLSVDECDTISFVNGTMIKARIIRLSGAEIKYRLCNNPDGPLYVILRQDVREIRYADGRKEVITTVAPKGDGEFISDSCLTIVRKNGTLIRARVRYLKTGKIGYVYCNNNDQYVKTLETLYIAKIVNDSGRDVLPEVEANYRRKNNADEAFSMAGDSCLTIVRKNGTIIKARVQFLPPDKIGYLYCNGKDHFFKTVETKFIAKVLDERGRDILPETQESYNKKIVTDEAGSIVGDSCVTIVRKNGDNIRARLSYINGDEIGYWYCNGNDRNLKTLETMFIAKIRTDGGKDVLGAAAAGKIPRRDNGWAIASLIVGLIGIFTGFPGLVAVIFGIVGIVQITRYPEKYKGSGMAAAGIILGVLETIVLLILLYGLSII